MADHERSEDGPPDPEEVRQMGRNLARNADAAMKDLGAVMLSEMAAEGRRWVQLSNAELQAMTAHSERVVRDRLAQMERQGIVQRDRRRGKPVTETRKGDRRGDFYAAAPVEEENNPARAGPTKERLGNVDSAPKPQGGKCSPDKEHEPKDQIQL